MNVNPMFDLYRIPEKDMPFIVLSDNMRSWIGSAIKAHESGGYNHLMWMVRPDYYVSQDFPLLKEVHFKKYSDGFRIKLWHNPSWTETQKKAIIDEVNRRLKANWYQRMYDPLQILGIKFGIRWLQIPGKSRICSDHANILRAVDPNFNMPTGSGPQEINKYLESNPCYEVYGRYMED